MNLPDPAKSIEQQQPRALLNMVLWDEARGEPTLGQLAVCHVILNRARAKRIPIENVILAKAQFSGFSDANHRSMMLNPFAHDTPAVWGAVNAVADLALLDITEDITHGALNYYNANLATPSWGIGHPLWKQTGTFGRHVFGTAG